MPGTKVRPGMPATCPSNSNALINVLFFLGSNLPQLAYHWEQILAQRERSLFAGSLETHLRSRPSYQTKGWTLSIHSEGKRYAHYRTETGLSVVTEAYVSNTTVTEHLNNCINSIRALAAEKDFPLPETSDLFLDINDTNTCSYWFVDHARRIVFWLHPVDPTVMGLPHAFSESHFRGLFYNHRLRKMC